MYLNNAPQRQHAGKRSQPSITRIFSFLAGEDDGGAGGGGGSTVGGGGESSDGDGVVGRTYAGCRPIAPFTGAAADAGVANGCLGHGLLVPCCLTFCACGLWGACALLHWSCACGPWAACALWGLWLPVFPILLHRLRVTFPAGPNVACALEPSSTSLFHISVPH